MIIIVYDYCLDSETLLSRGIWISFFDTEEAHAGMLAHGADEVPRATPVSKTKILEMDVPLEARRGT
jgi:hypothetical protein